LEIKFNTDSTFIRTPEGWYACGDNRHGQLGIGTEEENIRSFTKIINQNVLIRLNEN
jgi:alpha-tubulin suppressor-like RCC1 family protein